MLFFTFQQRQRANSRIRLQTTPATQICLRFIHSGNVRIVIVGERPKSPRGSKSPGGPKSPRGKNLTRGVALRFLQRIFSNRKRIWGRAGRRQIWRRVNRRRIRIWRMARQIFTSYKKHSNYSFHLIPKHYHKTITNTIKKKKTKQTQKKNKFQENTVNRVNTINNRATTVKGVQRRTPGGYTKIDFTKKLSTENTTTGVQF